MTSVHTSASLYVGDLGNDVTEALLFELFNAVGPVASIRVCRDTVTRRSLGYAYINFHNLVDAERALDTMNYTNIKGRPCRIMWSHRDPSIRKSGVGNVFIKNLTKAIDNKALYDTFSAFGNILSCKVMMDEEGNSRGYGFVHYETQEAADQAIAALDGMLFEGQAVHVGKFVPRSERQQGARKFTNVYVKNLPEDVDDAGLRTMFEAFGPVTSAVVMRDNKTGKSRGFGFCNFENADDALKAIDEMHEKEMGEEKKPLYCARAMKKSERQAFLRKTMVQKRGPNKYQGINLYVKHLDETVDDEALRNAFAPYGTITSARVMKEGDSTKGFGFVCFTTPEEATKAVTEMNGRMLGSKPIYVALAQRKDDRRMQLEAQYSQRQGGMRMQTPGGGMAMYTPPMYYAPPGMAAPRQGYMYPQMARPRWGAQLVAAGGRPGGYPAGMPNGAAGMGRGGHGPQMGAQGGRGFKFAPTARNRDQQGPISEQVAAPAAAVPVAATNVLTPAALAQAPPEQTKQILGERLYPLISAQQPELAGKITGMLLEMDNTELLNLLEAPSALDEKITEAMEVLREHQATQAGEDKEEA